MKKLVLVVSLIVLTGCTALPVKENIFYESNAERNLIKINNLEKGLVLEAEKY